jgi:tetratricopeptide (TPR) repeat protein
VGLSLYFSRRFEEAIEQFRSVLHIDPTFALAYLPLGGAYEQKGMLDSARLAFSTASIFTRGHPVAVAAMCHAYALSGMHSDAVTMLELLEERSRSEYLATYWKIVAYLGLNQTDRALNLLEQAIDEKDGLIVYLLVDPVFDSVRTHPRFIAAVRKLGLRGA